MSFPHAKQWVNGLSIKLYLLGLSGRVVQVEAEKVPVLKREKLMGGYKMKTDGADVSSVRCKRKGVQIGVSVDAITGMFFHHDQMPGEDAEQ